MTMKQHVASSEEITIMPNAVPPLQAEHPALPLSSSASLIWASTSLSELAIPRALQIALEATHLPGQGDCPSWENASDSDVHVKSISSDHEQKDEVDSPLLRSIPLERRNAKRFADVLQVLADIYAKDTEGVRLENARLRQELHQLKAAAQTDDEVNQQPSAKRTTSGTLETSSQPSAPVVPTRRQARNDTYQSSSMCMTICSGSGTHNGEDTQLEFNSLCNMMRTSEHSNKQRRRPSDNSGPCPAKQRKQIRHSTVKNFKSRVAWFNIEQIKSKTPNRPFSRQRASTDAIDTLMPSEVVSPHAFLRALVWHPGSYKRLWWDITSMILLAYDLVSIPFVGAFNPTQNSLLLGMTWGTLIFWTLDIFVSLLTGYQSSKHLILDPKKTAMNYFRSWFLLDAVVVGLDWVLIALQGDMEQGGSAARLGRSLRTLRFVRTLRLIRLVKLKRIFQEIQDHLNTETLSICFGISKIILCLLMANHVVACCWYAIGVSRGPDSPNWVTANQLDERSMMYQYTTSLHWSLTQFTPASMEIRPHNIRERIFSVVVLLFAMLTFSSFVSILTASMAELRRIGNDESQKFWLLRRYLRDWSVSRNVTVRVIRYLEYAYQRQRQRVQQTDVHLLRLLSEPLREELSAELFSTCLSVHPLFWVVNESVRYITKALQCHALARGDFVFCCGEDAHSFIFANNGSMEYLQGESFNDGDSPGEPSNSSIAGEYVLEGQWVSEAVLWTPWIHLGDLQAITECQTVTINAEEFAKHIRANKLLHSAVRKYAEVFMCELNKLEREELTDLLHQLIPPQEIVEECELTKEDNYHDEDGDDSEPVEGSARSGFQRFLGIFHRRPEKPAHGPP